MGVGKYFFILVVMFVTFLALLDLVFKLPFVRFELALTIVFMFFAFIIAIGFYYNAQWAYWLGAIFFALNLVNMIYLYYQVSSYSLVWLAVASALGFIVSVSSIRGEEDEFEELEEKRTEIEKQLGKLERETPKVEIIKEEKKPAKRAKPKKKPAKKKAKKKSSKKKSKK